jgi:hypothetical protein
LFFVSSNLGIWLESVSWICRRFRVVLITKQSRGQTFRTSAAFCFLFEFGGHRLRGVFLATVGADENQIEASF